MTEPVYLMFVDIKNGTQSNKFYNMTPLGDGNFQVEYGRVDSTSTTKIYPGSKWNAIYNSKIKKGYKDISHLKKVAQIISEDSGNRAFDEFYDVFSRYTGSQVAKTYISSSCTDLQLHQAQKLLNKISRLKKVQTINQNLKELYITIPRRMSDVRNHLISDLSQLDKIVEKEQDALDSMDSSNIMHQSNPYKDLNIDFEEVTNHSEMEKLLYPTMGLHGRRARIHKVYKIYHKTGQQAFDDWLVNQKDTRCKLLIHGTKNPNVFSILKSGLLIRPTNAASFAGSAYGDGIYHSAHSAKSLGYTGWDSDKIFLIQDVHMGKAYTYKGWFRDGKDLSYSDLNYQGLQKRGYDSLYVEPGDGLLNSEYIVYNAEQTVTNYVVWLK